MPMMGAQNEAVTAYLRNVKQCISTSNSDFDGLPADCRPGTSIPLPFLGAPHKSLARVSCLSAEGFYFQNIGSEIVDLAEH